jgi:hypothetical protein
MQAQEAKATWVFLSNSFHHIALDIERVSTWYENLLDAKRSAFSGGGILMIEVCGDKKSHRD